jgi:hypothetical protein
LKTKRFFLVPEVACGLLSTRLSFFLGKGNMRNRLARSLFLAAGLLLAAAPAGAATIAPTVTIGIAGSGTTADLGPLGTLVIEGPNTGSWDLNAPWQSYQAGYEYVVNSWAADLDVDPFVINNVSVTNTSGSIQTFIATVLLPIPAFPYNTVINSSVGVTTTDSNGDGVLLFDNSGATPIYTGTVNLAPIFTMNPVGPGTLPITIADCVPSFPGCTITSSNGTAFTAVPAGAATMIGITLTFRLSPGDSAGLTSRFEIVPEPGTLVLALSGLVGLGLVGRRRSS